jgi:hypothetical protein
MKLSKRITLAALLLLMSGFFCMPAQAEAFANPAFQRVWGQSDQAVKQGQANRTWLWGPDPGTSRQEPYDQAPGGQRLVQYFDKSRMEITNPGGNPNSTYYVTNGLLAKELVSGRLQLGDNRYEQRDPAGVPVGGDPDSPGPTYATFNSLASLDNNNRAAQRSGFINQTINRAGQIGTTGNSGNLARYAYYSPELGHNIPDVFYNTFQQWKASFGLDWVYAMGLPLTEPYWATFRVAGQEKELLVQIFERRALTYTPGNPAGFQVEMGNIGQHYYRWRYGSDPAPVSNPSTTQSNGLDAEEVQFLSLINQYRASKGLGALQLNNNLNVASRWMSNDMAGKNYFSHTDSNGRDFSKRLTDFGYRSYPQGENIAAGYNYDTAAAAMEAWKNSPGHNANMLNGSYTVIGIARAYNPNSTYHWYWTTDFGGNQ